MTDSRPPARSLPLWLYYGVLLLVASAFVLHDNSADRDLWHRLALGQYVFQNGALPSHDVFSYLSESTPLHDHEWGCGVLFYTLYHFLGDWSLVALKLAAYLAVIVLIDVTARFYYKAMDLLSLSWMLLVALALVPVYVSTVRCLVFTNLFLALWLYWLARLQAGYKMPAWPFVLTAVLWANLHGGFPAGLGLLALYGLGEKLNRRPWEPFFRIGFFAAVATLFNPYTYQLWLSTAKAVASPRLHIYEWAATPLGDFSYFGFKLLALATILVVILLLVTGRARANWDWVAILVVGLPLILAVRHLRHLALFSIIAGVIVYRGVCLLRRPASAAPTRHYLAVIVLPLLIIFGGFLLKNGDQYRLRVTEPDYPVRAVAFLEQNLPATGPAQKLLVPFNWGSYASWQLFPRALVSLDGRYELVYSQQTYRAVTDFFYNAPDWDTTLRQNPPDVILLPRRPELETRLLDSQHYRRVYSDDLAAVFYKTEPPAR
ncbi:MAG: hypothetical protein B9S26_15235 [Opitutia bacterium Tous-C4FEB]|nr:MAG: hypothetical protein B9S26_15235 [Opitutae bacterium Tous-C4FEB]